MKLIYINSDNSSVTEAQVFSLLKHYKHINEIEELTLLQGFRDVSEKDSLTKKLGNFKFNTVWFKRWHGYTFFRYLAYYTFSKALKKLKLDEETVIHVRGEIYGAIAQKFVKKNASPAKLLIDIRGVGYEEVNNYYAHNSMLRNNKARFFKESFNQIKNSQITVVSKAFKNYLVDDHGFKAFNICVHPNIASEQFTFDLDLRKQTRDKLQFSADKIVAICSSGGGSAWQKDNELITPLLNLGIQVINLSSKNVEISGVINKMVPFAEVPAYLAAADIAVLWRDDNVVNNVASPSKLSEFACMGLWLIHNGTVKIGLDYINDTNAGLIIDSSEELTADKIKIFSDTDRVYHAAVGRKTFGVEFVAASYVETYQKLLRHQQLGLVN
jgi:hypothetical protein